MNAYYVDWPIWTSADTLVVLGCICKHYLYKPSCNAYLILDVFCWNCYSCFKLKGSSSKALFTAKNVPPFCEIWFVCKGRHLWTREASEFIDHFLPVFRSDEAAYRDRFWLNPHNHDDELLLSSELTQDSFLGADLLGISSLDQNKSNHLAVASTIDSSLMCITDLCSSQEPFPTIDSPFDAEFPNEINSKVCVCATNF